MILRVNIKEILLVLLVWIIVIVMLWKIAILRTDFVYFIDFQWILANNSIWNMKSLNCIASPNLYIVVNQFSLFYVRYSLKCTRITSMCLYFSTWLNFLFLGKYWDTCLSRESLYLRFGGFRENYSWYNHTFKK